MEKVLGLVLIAALAVAGACFWFLQDASDEDLADIQIADRIEERARPRRHGSIPERRPDRARSENTEEDAASSAPSPVVLARRREAFVVLVAGQVVDQEGNPVDGARCRILAPRDEEEAGPSIPDEGEDEILSDEAGRFAIRGDPGVTDLQFRFFKDGYYGEHVLTEAGEKDMTVVLDHRAVLRGRFVLENGLSAFGVQAYLRSGMRAGGRAVPLQTDGSFELVDVEATRWILEVRDPAGEKATFSREISLRKGEVRDLGSLSLAFNGWAYHLEMVAPERAPRGLLVVARDPRTGAELGREVLISGRKSMFLATDVCDLELACAGKKKTIMQSVRAGAVPLRLEEGIPIRLDLVNGAVVPKGYEVEFWIDPQLKIGWYWLDGASRDGITHGIHAAGSYPVSATICRLPRRSVTRRVPLLPGRIDVLDKGTVQVFKVHLDEAAVVKALEELTQ